MKAQITVRQAMVQDAAALTRLNSRFNGSSEPAEVMAQRLADPRQVEIALVAESAGQVIAFAGLRLVPSLFYAEPLAELTELFVEEAYRRRGVGRALIVEAEQRAIHGGARELLILTDMDNVGAQALYHALGYEDDDLALRKTLVKPETIKQSSRQDV